MRVPMVDLQAEYDSIRSEVEPAMLAALASAQYIQGPNVKAFEEEASAYLGGGHAVSCASGTDALLLALRACDIGPGDEVITTPFSFVATASTILMTGATPVFADIHSRSFNLTPEAVEAAVTPRTRAVIPVHLFGQPADIASLRAVCDKHGLRLIEDVAQAFGADIDGRKCGTLGDIGCFSFYPSKNLGAFGDGGMAFTRDETLARKLRVLASHGSAVRYHHSTLGYNSRLDELQAVILRIKLRRVDKFNELRRAHARAYNVHLADSGIFTPFEDHVGTHVFHQYTIKSERRDAILAALTAAGISCAIFYPIPLHRQEMFGDRYADLHLPSAERVAGCVLSLPMSPMLTEAQIAYVADTVLAAVGG